MTDDNVVTPPGWRSNWKKPEETRRAKSIRARQERLKASSDTFVEGEVIPPPKGSRNKSTRPFVLDDELKAQIVERVASGETLKKILAPKDMPSYITVYRAELADEQFGKDMAIARQVQAAVLADEVIEISDDSVSDIGENGRVDFEVIARSKIRTDNRKWLIGKLDPKRWGDKVQTDITSGGEKIETKEFSPLESARQVAFALELAKRNQEVKE